MNRQGWYGLALAGIVCVLLPLQSGRAAAPCHTKLASTIISFSNGIFAVGHDIAPGMYHTAGSDGCYWARLHSLSASSFTAIIANDDASGPVTIQIKHTDVGFESENCGVWHYVRMPDHGKHLKAMFNDGAYGVRFDIPSGTYRTLGGDNCYWARSRDLGWATSAIIANDNAVGPVVVTIASSDGGFKTHNCGTWRKVPTPHIGGTSGATRFGDGTWRVGIDIKPGTYHTDGSDGCYYAELSAFGGGVSDIIANDNPSGPVTLTIDASQLGFESKGCGTWTRLH